MAKKTEKIVPVKVSPQTKKAIKVFQDKAPATDLLIENHPKKLHFVGHIKSNNEKFFDWLETDGGKHIALIITVAAVTAIAYWIIKQ